MGKIHFPALTLLASALCILVLSCAAHPDGDQIAEAPVESPPVRKADFGSEPVSDQTRQIGKWIAASRDNADHAFIVIDKKKASVYVFSPDARLLAASPVLLGAAIGDEAAPDIGNKPIEHILPHEQTTHAGRFIGELGRNARGEDVIWVDYDAAMSMHRVLTTNPREKRLERLASATIADNRVSSGCINVPVTFYESNLLPLFRNRQQAIIYVLPEVKSVRQVFGAQVPQPAAARTPSPAHERLAKNFVFFAVMLGSRATRHPGDS